jgi:hypothetical protein
LTKKLPDIRLSNPKIAYKWGSKSRSLLPFGGTEVLKSCPDIFLTDPESTVNTAKGY